MATLHDEILTRMGLKPIGNAHISVKPDFKPASWAGLKLKITCDYLSAILDMEGMLRGEFTSRDRVLARLQRQAKRRPIKVEDIA